MHMKELRQEAIKEWASGLLNWQPRRLVLLAPLCISNLLPTTLQLTLHQAEDEDASTSSGRLPTQSVAYGGSDQAIKLARQKSAKSDHLPQLASLKLLKGERQRVHGASAETRLQVRAACTRVTLALWIKAPILPLAPPRDAIAFPRGGAGASVG